MKNLTPTHKKSLKFFILLAFATFTLNAKAQMTPCETSLYLTVTDINGKPEVGATVWFYASQTDYLKDENRVPSIIQVTDGAGLSLVTNLKPQVYFFRILKGKKTNGDDHCRTPTPLERCKLSRATVAIQ